MTAMPKVFLKRVLRQQKGNALVMVALILTILMGITALVIDIGFAYYHKVKLSTAVDAAALAAATELPADKQSKVVKVIERAGEYAQKNGISAEQIQVEVINEGTGVRVTGEQHVNYFFAPILGIDFVDIVDTAEAHVGSVENIGSVSKIVPFAVVPQNPVDGVYRLKFSPLEKQSEENYLSGFQAGWLGILAFDDITGASTYEQRLKEGYLGNLKVNDLIQIEPGNVSGATSRGVQFRIEQCNHSAYSSWEDISTEHLLTCPRVVICPVVEATDDKKYVRVIDFAPFLLENVVEGSGIDCYVEGRFLAGIIDPGSFVNQGKTYGVYGIRLTK